MKSYLILSLCILIASVSKAQNPTLFGVTTKGGPIDAGTIYSYNLCSGEYRLRYNFKAGLTDGCCPQGGLLQANDKMIYGIAYSCGAYGEGTLFRFDLTNDSVTTLHNFGNGTDGAGFKAGALMQASDGLLYGTTQYGGTEGGGIIFSYDIANNVYTVVHNFAFQDTAEGMWPEPTTLVQVNDSTLYGVCSTGGRSSRGVIFSFNIRTGAVTSTSFNGMNGDHPVGKLLVATNGLYYGMTQNGGPSWDGTLYSFDPATDSIGLLRSFSMANYTGETPQGSLIQANNGLIYGATTGTVNVTDGLMFSYNAATDSMRILYNFNWNLNGAHPAGGFLEASDGALYTITRMGGTYVSGIYPQGFGTILKYDIATGRLTRHHAFGSSATNDGKFPQGPLIEVNDTFSTCSFISYTINRRICVGDTFKQGPSAYTQAGTYTDTVNRSCGICDSIVTVNLLVFPAPTPTTLNETTCSNHPFFFNGGYLYTSGQYVDHITNYNGCDSVVTLNLVVKTATETWVVDSFCRGDYYNFYGQLLSSQGIYQETFSADNGCDSVITLMLDEKYIDNMAWVSNGNICTVNQHDAIYQWITCDGKEIAGANSKSYTAAQNGDYRCVITVGICTDTTECLPVTALGIGDAAASQPELYPNVATDHFTITHSSGSVLNGQITDALGARVFTFTVTRPTQQVDIGTLPCGVYLVTLSNGDQLYATRKIIKQD